MHGFPSCTLSWYGFDCANSSAATSELTGMLSKGSQHSPWWMICPFLLVICHTDLFCNASARSENTYSSQRLVCKLESFAFRIISYIKSLHCVFDRQKSTDDFLIKLNSVAIFFSCLNHCSRYDMKDNEFNMFFLKIFTKKVPTLVSILQDVRELQLSYLQCDILFSVRKGYCFLTCTKLFWSSSEPAS